MLPALSPQRALEMFKNGEVRLIDIRESSEYAEKFIPGARLIPLSAIATQDLKDTSAPDKPLVSAIRETAQPRPLNVWNALPGAERPFRLKEACLHGKRQACPWNAAAPPSPCSGRSRSSRELWYCLVFWAVMCGTPCTGSQVLSERASSLPE